jgi:glucose/arabinose dehydrogenase
MRHPHILATLLISTATFALPACGNADALPPQAGMGPNPTLPAPHEGLIPTLNIAPAKGWPAGAMPVAAPGLAVTEFAAGLDHPRWLLVLPNGDVLVAETNAPPKPEDGKGIRGWVQGIIMKRAGSITPSANRITLLRATKGGAVADTRSVFIEGLHSPYGMALVGSDLYVADTDALLRFPYHEGDTKITAPGEKIVDLPAGPINHHWTKNVIANADGSRLYVTVGSNSNAGDNGLAAEEGRAAIWEIDPKTGDHRIFASGIRNPNGMGWVDGTLWTVANERDELGNDLVPDYLTSVKDGAFYGFPFSYYGQHVETRLKEEDRRPDMVAKAIPPDYALGSHVAALGLAFSLQGDGLPAPYAGGAFIGEHGSWNRNPRSGYKVVFVPFADGKPSGLPMDVLTGFLDSDGDAMGRPVGVAMDGKGGLLVADDVGNKVWRVAAAAQ